MPIFGLAPNQSTPKSSTWPTSSNATTASTSSPTRASTRSPDGIAAAGIPLVVAVRTPKRSSLDWRSTRRRVANARRRDSPSGRSCARRGCRCRRRELRPTTAKRYEWIIRNYIAPVVGDLQLTSLRAEHFDRLYTELVDRGAANGGPLASKTVYDVHVVIRLTRPPDSGPPVVGVRRPACWAGGQDHDEASPSYARADRPQAA